MAVLGSAYSFGAEREALGQRTLAHHVGLMTRPGTRRVLKKGVAPDVLFVVAPTLPVARSAARRLAPDRHGLTLRPATMARFLSAENSVLGFIAAPAGRTVAEDLNFLRQLRDRLLWPRPEENLLRAISGLRPVDTPRIGKHAGPAPRGTTALLLEGEVTRARARGARAAHPVRDWIVENVRRVKLQKSDLERLRLEGVRWSVLEPAHLVGLAASPELARARRFWRELVPHGTPVWTLPEPAKARDLRLRSRSRKPSRR